MYKTNSTSFKKGNIPWNKGLHIYCGFGKGKNHPDWKGGSLSHFARIARAVYREHNINIICEKCGSPDDICIHHIDKNIRNNQINNLLTLCRSCHTILHIKKNKVGVTNV